MGNEKLQWFSKYSAKDKLHKPKEWQGKKWYYIATPIREENATAYSASINLPSAKVRSTDLLKQGKELQNKREKRKLAPAASPKKRTMKLDRALAASQATAEDDKDEEENSTSDSEE